MDNAVSQAPVLAFPPDIWAYLVTFIPGEQLGRLKNTGAISIWRKLSQPGVVRSLNLGSDYLRFSSWPSFVNDFPSLQEISIDSSTEKWSSFGLRLDVIPATVRKLALRGVYANPFPFFVGKDGNALRLSEYLPHLESLDLKDVKTEDYAWLAHVPSSLTDLKIHSWDGQTALPSSLIYFEVHKTEIISLPKDFTLPPGLESLETLGWNAGMGLIVPFLPPGFRQLKSVLFQPHRISYSIDQLPQSLTLLNILWYCDPTKFQESVSLLPPHLTSLNIPPNLNASLWPKLPSQLKTVAGAVTELSSGVQVSIVDPGTGKHHQVKTIPFGALPRSITELRLTCAGPQSGLCYPTSSPTIYSYFPPLLQTLSLGNLHVSVEAAKTLPASLTDLCLVNLCERVCEHLPRGLKKLLASATLMSPNLIKHLPQSLTSLTLMYATPNSRWYNYTTCERIDSISKLPEFAAHQNYGSNVDWKAFTLPPSLTYLALIRFTDIGDSFIMNQKLPNLRTLDLRDTKLITDSAVPYLSPHLLSLDLRASDCISGKCFSLLPKGLTYLDLRASTSIFDSDIQELPRDLNTVFLTSATQLTNVCVQGLPRHLKRLDLKGNVNITPDSAPNFPYPLRSCRFRAHCNLAKWKFHHGEVIQDASHGCALTDA